ncbi:unnamed protein product [Adineta steineri]|uniref:Uncharacterized protein n=1 Tax=Adineta steineri TaxID=433720 RepID=A0A820FJV8_9BILA|nr:unnamed protein product [Adineta steineri]CAF4261648.1 unnamed protein product [Adineta steineri]
MLSPRYIAIGCLILLGMCELANGLRCYRCDKCNDPFTANGINITTVTPDAGYQCYKDTLQNSLTERGIVQDCKEVNALNTGRWCCNKDLCNGATPTASSIHLIFVLATIVITMLF